MKLSLTNLVQPKPPFASLIYQFLIILRCVTDVTSRDVMTEVGDAVRIWDTQISICSVLERSSSL
jgi:hypothetical protein